MAQQFVAEIHTKKGDVYYYVTDNLNYIADLADWFQRESADSRNLLGVYRNLDILLGLRYPQAETLLVNRGDLSHILYRNVRISQNEDGTHTAYSNV